MDSNKPTFRHPKKQIPLLLLGALVIYGFLSSMQGQETALDVAYANGYAFVAAGGAGGLQIFSLNNPAKPQRVALVDTWGAADNIAVAYPYVYLGDGKEGVRIFDVSDVSAPREVGYYARTGNGFSNPPLFVFKRGRVTDVAIDAASNRLAVAFGADGGDLVDVANPRAPRKLADFPASQKVAFNSTFGQLLTLETTRGITVRDINTAAEIGKLDTPGNAVGLAVQDGLAAIANENNGFLMTDVYNAAQPSQISETSIATGKNDVQNVALAWPTLYIANGKNGISVYEVSYPESPLALTNVDTPGTARSVALSDNGLLLVADGAQGLLVYNRIEPTQLIRLARVQFDSANKNVFAHGFRFTLMTITFGLWLVFFSQFVVPVPTLGKRYKVFERLLLYWVGWGGPALYIKDGELQDRHSKKKLDGPGIVVLDTASAAVLRTGSRFTRPVGPGVEFTEPFEKVLPAHIVSLYRKTDFIGPGGRINTEIFDPKPTDDSLLAKYEELQKARRETSAMTRDGIEVVPNVIAVFKLDSKPGEGNTQFGYNPDSVWKAAAVETVNYEAPKDAKERFLPWNKLPAYIAVDVLREYMRKFTLNELFTPCIPDPENRDNLRTGFEVIATEVTQRMTKPEARILDAHGRYVAKDGKDGWTSGWKTQKSREYEIVQARGIQIVVIVLNNLRLPPAVDQAMLAKWLQDWKDELEKQRGATERSRLLAQYEGEAQALRDYANWCCRHLAQALKNGNSPNEPYTLEMLVQSLKDNSREDLDLQRKMSGELEELTELIQWTRSETL
ncbi:MAG: hypothetical protein OHK0052_02290 [Anaerolineales bacterium]